jgi:hypothetical protein
VYTTREDLSKLVVHPVGEFIPGASTWGDSNGGAISLINTPYKKVIDACGDGAKVAMPEGGGPTSWPCQWRNSSGEEQRCPFYSQCHGKTVQPIPVPAPEDMVKYICQHNDITKDIKLAEKNVSDLKDAKKALEQVMDPYFNSVGNLLTTGMGYNIKRIQVSGQEKYELKEALQVIPSLRDTLEPYKYMTEGYSYLRQVKAKT